MIPDEGVAEKINAEEPEHGKQQRAEIQRRQRRRVPAPPREDRPAVPRLPGRAVELRRVLRHRQERRLIGARGEIRAATDQLRAAAVVLQIKNQRILELPLRLQLRDDAPNALVHAVELRGVNLHATCLERLVLHVRPLLSGRDLGPFLVEQAELFQLRPPRRAHRLEARVVAALVFGNVRIFRVQRPVRGGERGVEEERLRLLFACVVADKFHRVIRDRVGVIKFLGLILRVVRHGDQLVVARERTRIEVTARAVNRAIETIKAALERPVVRHRQLRRRLPRRDVPLAHGVVAIARRLQRLGDRHALAV